MLHSTHLFHNAPRAHPSAPEQNQNVRRAVPPVWLRCKDPHVPRVPRAPQALWVFIILLPVLVCNDQTVAAAMPGIGLRDGVGWALWLLGFAVEVAADAQKRAFRATAGRGKFIKSGLWAYSRCSPPPDTCAAVQRRAPGRRPECVGDRDISIEQGRRRCLWSGVAVRNKRVLGRS